MDEMMAFVKLDKETRKEVIDYYIKVKKAQKELLAKVHSIHAYPSNGKVGNVSKQGESEKKPHKRIGSGILQKTIGKIVQKHKEKVEEAKKAEVKAEKANEKEQQKKEKSNEKEENEDKEEHGKEEKKQNA
ncbi:unnamed protein product [Toxocara canis]|uniref:Uncharacterized protein n=1 Tax=Toxocara canis TaxID=6265 RepID=A0A183U4B2_TOXCA|nr:unnamed protein product [Toxocara canis]